MKCPQCSALITKKDIEIEIGVDDPDDEDEYDFIEVNVYCSKCEKTSFSRIKPEDLIIAG